MTIAVDGTDFANIHFQYVSIKTMLRNLEAEKVHIAVLGRQNVGKSKLINSIFGQELYTVDHKPGTIVDSLHSEVELSPSGPILIIDIIGLDNDYCFETSKLNKVNQTLSATDLALLVLDAREELDVCETELIASLQKNHIPFIVAVNKIEFGTNPHLLTELEALEVLYFEISCKENAGMENLRKKLIHLLADLKQAL